MGVVNVARETAGEEEEERSEVWREDICVTFISQLFSHGHGKGKGILVN